MVSMNYGTIISSAITLLTKNPHSALIITHTCAVPEWRHQSYFHLQFWGLITESTSLPNNTQHNTLMKKTEKADEKKTERALGLNRSPKFFAGQVKFESYFSEGQA